MLTYQIWLQADADGAFAIFRVVSSDSDDLPIGKVRTHWAPAALREKDEKIREVENFYRGRVVEAAALIRERYKPEEYEKRPASP